MLQNFVELLLEPVQVNRKQLLVGEGSAQVQRLASQSTWKHDLTDCDVLCFILYSYSLANCSESDFSHEQVFVQAAADSRGYIMAVCRVPICCSQTKSSTKSYDSCMLMEVMLKIVRFYFLKLREDISANLHEHECNLKEMNEYKNQLEIPEL
ncbi:unnamed protein product [Moneuplotes crassus]|uniref:Uncharacterized protein n=1 Tax=Euplotes crassus TaxID=5936 RepID=A0AAD1XLJ2_EUPCR|nr:unnamed protein product [Moneuplotes crassus]